MNTCYSVRAIITRNRLYIVSTGTFFKKNSSDAQLVDSIGLELTDMEAKDASKND